jgi:hypothetical protein
MWLPEFSCRVKRDPGGNRRVGYIKGVYIPKKKKEKEKKKSGEKLPGTIENTANIVNRTQVGQKGN